MKAVKKDRKIKISRRDFFEKTFNYLPVIAVGSFSFSLLRLVFYPNGLSKTKFTISLKKLISRVTKFKNPPLFIVKTKKSKLLALDSHCTHMGCIVNFDADKNIFVCPCHGSEYNIDGINIRGPTKRPLHKESIKKIDGKAIVEYIYYKIV